MSAMRFLNLIDVNARPTAAFEIIDFSHTESTVLHYYDRLRMKPMPLSLKGTLDTQNATYAELEDVFQNTYR